RESGESFGRVFVAVFGMDGFAAFEFEGFSIYRNLLLLAANEMHFDALALRLVKCAMCELAQIEVGAKLAIDTSQQIEIERCCDTVTIVVGRMQRGRVLHKIDPHDHHRATAKNPCGVAQKRNGSKRLKISDRGTWEKTCART